MKKQPIPSEDASVLMFADEYKGPDFDRNPENREGIFFFYKRLFFYYKKHFQLSSVLGLLTVILAIFPAIIPLITKAIFDNALANKDVHLFLILLSILIFGLLLLAILWVITDILQALIGGKISNELKLSLFKAIHYLSYKNYRQNKPGELLHRFESFNMLTYVLTQVVASAVGNLLFVLIAAGVMIYLNWQLSMLVFIVIPLTFYCANRVSHLAERQFNIKEADDARLFNMAREDIDFHILIPLLRIITFRTNLYEKKLVEFEKKDFLYNTYLLLTNTIITIGVMLLQLLIIALGSYWVFTGHLTIGAFIAFLTIYASSSYAINTLGAFYPALIRGANALVAIDAVLMFPTSHEQERHLPELPVFSKCIRFHQVSFKYSEQFTALRDINLEILSGESVAIIGPSGAGKSTLLDLLLRQESPDSGQIEFDGKNIWEYSERSLMSQIGIVPRNPGLFLMSIADNIRLGKLNALEDEITAAAKAAEIHEEILALPDGYNTLVVWGGANLSTGQKQRIVLARALVGNPAILILDEATSALDAYNQAAINATLRKQAAHRTSIFITHQLKEAVDCAKIILMDKGRIVEIGSHQELLEAKGMYFQLWEKQTGISISADRKNIQIKLSWLRKIPLFEKLSDDLLQYCVEKLMIEEAPPDKVIFEEGDIGLSFYIIVNGRVSISKSDSAHQRKEIAILENGDFFGEIALLFTRLRTARVTTLEACSFLVLHQAQFSDVLSRLPVDVREDLQQTARARLQVPVK